MDLLWPGFLSLLGLIPLIVAVYICMLRRRRRFAVRYSSLTLVREALPQHSRLRHQSNSATVHRSSPVTVIGTGTEPEGDEGAIRDGAR